MDIRYRQVRIAWNPKLHILPPIMTRLSDPFVARKVKHLIIKFIYDPKTIRSFCANATKNKGSMIGGINKWVSSSKYFPFKDHNTRSLEAIMNLMGKLQNTAIFKITTNFNDEAEDVWIPPTFMRNLSSVWTSLGHSVNLQSLSIRAEVLVLQEISAMKPYFQSLISLQISTIPLSKYEIDQVGGDPSLNALAPFINNISPKLKKLGLIFSGLYHLPDLFRYLSKSLALEELKIKTLMHGSARDDSGLKTFLCGDAHIFRELDLNIRTTYQREPANPILNQLLLNCTADEKCFSHLQSLKICPTGLARTDILCKAIQRASNDLQDLVIYEAQLSQEELLIVIDALSKCAHLAYIRLQINKLDVTIMDSMAKNLPGLKRLDIWWNVTGGMPKDRHIIANLQKRHYLEWKLEQISIYCGRSAKVDTALMRAFGGSVPTINSYCGRRHIEEIQSGGWYRIRVQ